VTIDDSMAEGNKVAIWYTVEGTHRGEFAGVPATGKHVEWSGVDLLIIEHGKITQARFLSDFYGLTSQLSAKPANP
jgi:predicted ester cyclase